MCPAANPGEILVVEDPMIQKLVQGVLSRQGYVVTGLSAAEALEQLRHEDNRFVLITNRPEAFLPLTEITPLLYISGCPDQRLAARFAHCRCLLKPFRPKELVEAVRELAGVAVL